MIMSQYDRGSMILQSNIENYFRICYSPGLSTLTYQMFGSDFIGPVLKQDPEFFMVQILKLRYYCLIYIFAGTDMDSLSRSTFLSAPT